MKIEYLNTDLELRSTADLTLLATWFDRRAVVMYHGEEASHYLMVVEVACPACSDDTCATTGADTTIQQLLTLIEQLPPYLRALWDQCDSRTFDIGIQSTADANRTFFALPMPLETLGRIVSAHGQLNITVYPVDSD